MATMRLWLISLTIANVLLAGYGWYSSSLAASSYTVAPSELNRDRIKLVAPGEARAAMLERSSNCLEWGAFTVADAARAEQALAALPTPITVRDRRVEGGPRSWWVYLPQANRRAADRVGDELKRLGAGDFYVVQAQDDPKFANAVSLGLFSTEQAAAVRRDQIARLGVRGEIAVQPRDSANSRIYLRLRDVPIANLGRLATLRAELGNAELRECGG
jgi:hypothetical protein